MANLFAMVTLKKSTNYTINALHSFFKYTKLEKEDDFFLIDNDNLKDDQFSKFNQLTLINNEKPLSFAQNVNQAIDEAIKNKKNLIFLKNEIIFTKNWFKAISLISDSISLPSNNQIFQYESELGILKLKVTMNLSDFNDNYDLLEEILEQHRKKIKSGQTFQTLLMPFFAFKVPYKILKDIGHFDISFGAGGISSLERCCLGLPTATIIVNDNQKEQSKFLNTKQAQLLAGSWNNITPNMISDTYLKLTNIRTLKSIRRKNPCVRNLSRDATY